MVLDSIMREIKNFCKDDDACIFVILVLIGFLLCMFFNRDEGFASYPFGEPGKPSGGKPEGGDAIDKHDYGPAGADIGRIPTQAGKATDEGVKAPPDTMLPQVAKPEELPGLAPKNPGEPPNGRGSLDKEIQVARQGQQFPSEILPNTGGISTKAFGLDSGGPMGVPMTYSAYFPYAKFDKEPRSDLGPAFPVGEPTAGPPASVQVAAAPAAGPAAAGPAAAGPAAATQDSQVPGVKKEMKLVLFYAPWCGHSKSMLGDYDAVIQQYDNNVMNGITLSIIKIDMAANKQGAEPYDVDVKGFPTLYTFVEENGKLVSQPFGPRDKDAIIAELQKRTQSYGS